MGFAGYGSSGDLKPFIDYQRDLSPFCAKLTRSLCRYWMSACSLLAIIIVQANIMCNYVTGSSGCERRCVTGLDKWMACWRSEGLYLEICIGVLCLISVTSGVSVEMKGKGGVVLGECCARTGLQIPRGSKMRF